jgi:uncharacterized membrane protein
LYLPEDDHTWSKHVVAIYYMLLNIVYRRKIQLFNRYIIHELATNKGLALLLVMNLVVMYNIYSHNCSPFLLMIVFTLAQVTTIITVKIGPIRGNFLLFL